MLNLEKAIEEAVGEYRIRIKNDPDLGRRFSATDTHPTLKGRNRFEVNVYLIQQIRKAYETDDKEMLAEIPLCLHRGQSSAANSVTYNFIMFGGIQPFTNETAGENVYWITNCFKDFESSDKKTEFFQYLNQQIEEFKSERDSVRDEILETPSYLQSKEKVANSSKEEAERVLRESYRDEEFKRKDVVIQLCDKAEHVYSLASRLFEELRPTNT